MRAGHVIIRDEKEGNKMKLNLSALTVAFAVVWSGSVLITGVAHSIWPGYGRSFLLLLASIYPGFSASGSLGDAVVGSLYALVDAAVIGFIFSWLYNLIAGAKSG
jgi:ABC-type phosphate transport system permease subunit